MGHLRNNLNVFVSFNNPSNFNKLYSKKILTK